MPVCQREVILGSLCPDPRVSCQPVDPPCYYSTALPRAATSTCPLDRTFSLHTPLTNTFAQLPLLAKPSQIPRSHSPKGQGRRSTSWIVSTHAPTLAPIGCVTHQILSECPDTAAGTVLDGLDLLIAPIAVSLLRIRLPGPFKDYTEAAQ